MADPVDPRPSLIERAAESAQAALLSRFGVPIMLAVLGTIALRNLDRIETGLDTTQATVARVQSDVRDLNTRLDAQVLRQVESNSKRGDDHEQRLRALELRQVAP